MSGTSGELRLFVTLKVKPEQFAIYLKAMQEEAAGARSEAGNLGFDLFEDADHAHTLYLLEHWASRAALEQDHARQPYYIHVRGLEAEALTGEVEERQLLEVEPQQVRQSGDAKSVAGAHTQVTVLRSTDDDALADLDRAFGEAATAFRNAGGNRAFSLFRDQGNAHERLLLEAWDDAASREAAWRQDAGRGFARILESAPWAEKARISLTER